MEFPYEQNLDSLKDTHAIANEISKIFKENDVIVLNGNLGSGKTTFVKAICSNFNISNVSSPSFAIVNEYHGSKKVFHFDFYRIKKLEELYDIGFEEYLNDHEAIIFIEWGNLMQEIIPEKHYEINLELKPQNSRHVKIFKKN